MNIVLIVYDRERREYNVCNGLDKFAMRLVFSGEMRIYQLLQWLQKVDELKDDHCELTRQRI